MDPGHRQRPLHPTLEQDAPTERDAAVSFVVVLSLLEVILHLFGVILHVFAAEVCLFLIVYVSL